MLRMLAGSPSLSYLPIEVQSYLPSGWGIVAGASPAFDSKKKVWSIPVYDGANTIWSLDVESAAVAKSGRLGALAASVDRLSRKALGRHSIWTG